MLGPGKAAIAGSLAEHLLCTTYTSVLDCNLDICRPTEANRVRRRPWGHRPWGMGYSNALQDSRGVVQVVQQNEGEDLDFLD